MTVGCCKWFFSKLTDVSKLPDVSDSSDSDSSDNADADLKDNTINYSNTGSE